MLLSALIAGNPCHLYARPLTDGVSSTLNIAAEPGFSEINAQQNLTPFFGCQAGVQRMQYLDAKYSGWEFGSNWLLARILSENWKATALLNVGLSGLQGEGHGHMGIWARSELDWETRHVLFLLGGGIHRGAAMPTILEAQVRAGYSPFPSEMQKIQPWLIAAYTYRSGTGGGKILGILRLIRGSWSLELGATPNLENIRLGASLAL